MTKCFQIFNYKLPQVPLIRYLWQFIEHFPVLPPPICTHMCMVKQLCSQNIMFQKHNIVLNMFYAVSKNSLITVLVNKLIQTFYKFMHGSRRFCCSWCNSRFLGKYNFRIMNCDMLQWLYPLVELLCITGLL